MARFHFHKHQDGKQIEDHKGRSFPDEKAACRHAFREVAAIIGRIGRGDDHAGTYVGIEVEDGERTRCSVRAFIVIEHPRRTHAPQQTTLLLVMGIAETMAALSILFGTFVGGIYGAASGAFFRSGIFGIASNVDISLQGIGQVATTGVVFGFIMGAILGFVLSSSLAATVFFFAQIERNTRGLLERARFEVPTQYRADPRF